MFGIDSPSIRGEEYSVLRPCDLKWLCKRGDGAVLSILGILLDLFGCGFVVGIWTRMGKGWIVFCGVGLVVDCRLVGRVLGGM